MIRAHDLDVDWRRQPKIQESARRYRRAERRIRLRETGAGRIRPQPAHVLRRRMMMFRIQRNQNLRIAGSDHARTAVGEIDTRVREPDIIEHGLQFFLRNLAAQHPLHFIAQLGRLLHAQPGPRAKVQPDQAPHPLVERNPAPERTPAPTTTRRKLQSKRQISRGCSSVVSSNC